MFCYVAATFQLSEPDYSAIESETEIAVTIEKTSEVFLANPVMFMITPMMIDETFLSEMIEPLNPFAPNRAGQIHT